MKAMFIASERINQEVADSDKTGAAGKVYASYKRFRDQIRSWHKINEYAYHDALKTVGALGRGCAAGKGAILAVVGTKRAAAAKGNDNRQWE